MKPETFQWLCPTTSPEASLNVDFFFLLLLFFRGSTESSGKTAELSPEQRTFWGLFLMVLVLFFFKALPAGNVWAQIEKQTELNPPATTLVFLFPLLFPFMSSKRVCVFLHKCFSVCECVCLIVHVTKTHRIRKLCDVCRRRRRRRRGSCVTHLLVLTVE